MTSSNDVILTSAEVFQSIVARAFPGSTWI